MHTDITPPTYSRLVASQGSKLHEEQHKGHEVYTSSGHHCGVIPYSSLWCGGLPQGLMMNNTREEQPREGLFLAGAMNCLGEFSRLSLSLVYPKSESLVAQKISSLLCGG